MKSAEEWYPEMAKCAGLVGRYNNLKAVVDYDDSFKFIIAVQKDALEAAAECGDNGAWAAMEMVKRIRFVKDALLLECQALFSIIPIMVIRVLQ